MGDTNGIVIELGARPDRATAHIRWCAALAETAATGLDGPDAACWEARLRHEEPNLMAALASAERAGDCGAGVALRLWPQVSWRCGAVASPSTGTSRSGSAAPAAAAEPG